MADPRATTGACVLLVDDEPDQVEMYRYALADSGFTVSAAANGAEALARARELSPDLIVLDLLLPDMSGWDVCAALKADPSTARIPVLVLTAAATTTLASDAERAGCAGALLKPCYPDQLIATIRALLATT